MIGLLLSIIGLRSAAQDGQQGADGVQREHLRLRAVRDRDGGLRRIGRR